jgi:RNA polymerase sigma-70 factor, ECF subfamily
MDADFELIQHIVINRDAAAFDSVYARYAEAVRRHVARYIHDAHAVDDITQEAFLRVWTRGEQWDGRGSFGAWLLRIARNLSLNYLRAVHRRRQEPLDGRRNSELDGDDSPAPGWLIDASALGPDAVAERAEQRRLLDRLVGELPEGKREVMRLVYDAEMEIQEVSETLRIPEGTVKSRLHHARKRLAREWEALENGDQ